MLCWKLCSCQVCPRPKAQYARSFFSVILEAKMTSLQTLSFFQSLGRNLTNVAVSARYLHCLLFKFPVFNFLVRETGFLEMKKVLECIREWYCWRLNPTTGVWLAEVRHGMGSSRKPINSSWKYEVCVCVCVCVRERERERERDLLKRSKKETNLPLMWMS
jgi:hypothetical protein